MEKLHLFLGISFYYLFLSFGFIKGAPSGSLISSLPGFNGTLPSKHYSGYISFNEKNLFYYFVVSERNPSKDPTVLWLNGGPGCSSFDGFVYEHRPFTFREPRQRGRLPRLSLNPYRWSKVSNIIYLDSPCGVGLSYSLNSTKYITGDLQTALDTHSFLLKWFQLYPEFGSNPFYISGESYAGVYVPTLARQVVKGIKSGAKPVINFKGYLIGNGVTRSEFEGYMVNHLPYAHGMGLISDEIFKEMKVACKDQTHVEACDASVRKVQEATEALNAYAILEPCYLGPSKRGKASRPTKSKVRLGRAWGPLRISLQAQKAQVVSHPGGVHCAEWQKNSNTEGLPESYPDDEAAWTWLNDESVRKAIHAKPKTLSGPWELCSDRVVYQQDGETMLPYHNNLTRQGYRVLIYSGDHDLVVPFVGTQAWTRSLGYKKIEEWRPWMFHHQVSGYVQGYANNLTFLTIKGAGHMVPQYKPPQSLAFYTRWLDGKPI